jgi:hypothetical protein
MNDKSVIFSFRVKVKDPLYKYLSEYADEGNVVSDHIRSVLDKFVHGETELGLRRFEAILRSHATQKHTYKWCIKNMSEHHLKLMTEYVKEKIEEEGIGA